MIVTITPYVQSPAQPTDAITVLPRFFQRVNQQGVAAISVTMGDGSTKHAELRVSAAGKLTLHLEQGGDDGGAG